ncbi:hypothetical protein AFLA70_310g001101 [Aspergillus flavus AF70]|nr:hypothetical protein AFLA70_310g001101 [Aspergillus flavus AF70]
MASTTLSSRCRVCGKRPSFVECLTCKAMLQNSIDDWDNLDFLSPEGTHTVSHILLIVKMLIDFISLEQSMSSLDTIFPHEDFDQSHTFVPESPVVATSNQIMDEDSLQEIIAS